MIFGLANQIVKSKAKGQFFSVTWNKQLQTLKEFSDVKIEKVSRTVVRLGVRYEKTKAVIEKYGKDYQAQPLKWGKWKENEFPYFIEHNGNTYLRCTTIKSPYVKTKTKYFANGKEISKQQAEKMCLAKEFGSGHEDVPVFTLNIDNILAIR